MCNCGLKANSLSVINGAYMMVEFIADVVDYTGTTTGRLYGSYLTGEQIQINIADFDNSVMIQI